MNHCYRCFTDDSVPITCKPSNHKPRVKCALAKLRLQIGSELRICIFQRSFFKNVLLLHKNIPRDMVYVRIIYTYDACIYGIWCLRASQQWGFNNSSGLSVDDISIFGLRSAYSPEDWNVAIMMCYLCPLTATTLMNAENIKNLSDV